MDQIFECVMLGDITCKRVVVETVKAMVVAKSTTRPLFEDDAQKEDESNRGEPHA